jgi:hypothetical protein
MKQEKQEKQSVCGHSACRQNWIDTGEVECIAKDPRPIFLLSGGHLSRTVGPDWASPKNYVGTTGHVCPSVGALNSEMLAALKNVERLARSLRKQIEERPKRATIGRQWLAEELNKIEMILDAGKYNAERAQKGGK